MNGMRKIKGMVQTNYFVDKSSLPVHGAVILMALSALFRLIGSFGLWKDPAFVPTLVALPLACNLFFIAFLMLFGKRALWMTSFPFTMGSVFFVIKSFGTTGVFGKAVCILLYTSAAVVYISTTTGWLKSKWLLLLLLMSIFVYYVAVEDLRVFTNPSETVSFATVMSEISSVFLLLGFILTAFAMKNRRPLEEYDLPKMKAPKLLVRKDGNKAANAAEKQTDTEENGQTAGEAEVNPAKNETEEKTGGPMIPNLRRKE